MKTLTFTELGATRNSCLAAIIRRIFAEFDKEPVQIVLDTSALASHVCYTYTSIIVEDGTCMKVDYKCVENEDNFTVIFPYNTEEDVAKWNRAHVPFMAAVRKRDQELYIKENPTHGFKEFFTYRSS